MASPVVTRIPSDARRVAVRGTSGSGKSTMAAAIADARGLPHVELDSIMHQPGWTPLPDDEFAARVDAVAAGPTWVVCGNYSRFTTSVLDRADTIVLYDLPRPVVMWRIVRRTLRRISRREVLWNGNRERWRNFFSLDPETSVIVWAWTTHGRRHAETLAFVADPPRDGLRIVHVASLADERRVRDSLRGAR
ncbi:MAG TPA: hypothetical protein VKT18_08230 [Acidimicrobiales bacterium]|nr:hypothetical protein [Acidimicrobiales bacterium]